MHDRVEAEQSGRISNHGPPQNVDHDLGCGGLRWTRGVGSTHGCRLATLPIINKILSTGQTEDWKDKVNCWVADEVVVRQECMNIL